MNHSATGAVQGKITDSSDFFELLADAYVIIDIDLRIRHFNRRFAELFCLGGVEIVGKILDEILQFGDERQRRLAALWLRENLPRLSRNQTRSSPNFKFDLEKDSGLSYESRFWSVTASILNLSGAESRYFALRVSDVTARAAHTRIERQEKAQLRSHAQLRAVIIREAQQKLEESQADLEQALAMAKIGAWQMDMATGVITCSDQCKFNMGMRADESLSENRLFTEIIHPDDRESVGAELTEALATHRNYAAEYRLASQPEKWVLAGGRAKYDTAGAPFAMTGFTLDITARKHEELAQRQIATEQREAREESDRNALAMDHFLTTVTHELRSPIGVILNWAQLLKQAPAKLDLQRVAATFERNALQLSLMVGDLLDSGAIVSGKLSIEPIRLPFDRLVREVVTDLTFDAERKGLQLRLEQIDNASVWGDEARIKQVVWNLVTNAIKFCDAGYIEVRLSTDGAFARLDVTDTGCGLDQEAVSRIFQRFEQVRTKTSSRVDGLGLGLWLVKNLVERHGGSVEVSSAGLRNGSTFTVYLPLNQD